MFRVLRFSRPVFLLAFLWLIGLSSAQTPSGTTPRELWFHDEVEALDRFELTSANHLLLMSDRIALLDRETGKPRWSRDDIPGCFRARGNNLVQFRAPVRCKYLSKFELGFEALPGEPPIVVGHNPEDGQFVLIDASNGRTLFETDGTTPGKVRDYSYIEAARQILLWVEVKDERYVFARLAADGQLGSTFDSTIVKDLVWLGSRDAASMLVYGKDRGDKRVIAEIDLKSQRTAWQLAGVLSQDIEDGPKVIGGGGRWRQKPYQYIKPVFDTDSSVLIFITKDGPLRVSREGKVLWQVGALKGKEPTLLRAGDGIVVVGEEKDVTVIDAASGNVLWRYKGKSKLSGVESHARGLVVWSEASATQLNPRTGAPSWTKEAPMPEKWDDGFWLTEGMRPDYSRIKAPKLIVGDVAYIAGPTRLVSLNLQDGSVKDIVGYRFQSGTPVTALEIVNNEFVLSTPDAVARFDGQGELKFHQQYKQVGASGGGKALVVANYLLNPFSVNDPSRIDAVFAERYVLNAKNDTISFFLYESPDSTAEKKFGILCVERATGKEIGTFWIYQRNPEMVVDKELRTVYLREKNSIRAVRF